jgi:hypothetical protein
MKAAPACWINRIDMHFLRRVAIFKWWNFACFVGSVIGNIREKLDGLDMVDRIRYSVKNTYASLLETMKETSQPR